MVWEVAEMGRGKFKKETRNAACVRQPGLQGSVLAKYFRDTVIKLYVLKLITVYKKLFLNLYLVN